MPWLATAVLILWPLIVFALFTAMSFHRAIVFSFVTGWLFLPTIAIQLPGFPDWSKTTATVFGVMVSTAAKHPQKILAFRPRWYDLPILLFCLAPFASSITTGSGAYDGLSSILDELFRWGIPYLIGRIFLSTAENNRRLAMAIAIGGIVYIPLCLIEIRLSPVLKLKLYQIAAFSNSDFGLRYGGYRPVVFLSTGLELGWWMCCATLCTMQLWASGAVKKLWGYPMKLVTGLMVLTTLACKSTGAIIQLAVGLAVIYFGRYSKTSLLAWAILLIPPIYCAGRPTGMLTSATLKDFAYNRVGGERGQSLAYRFDQEDILIRHALLKPVFGWARAGFNPIGPSGKAAVPDGFWIITLGSAGYVSLFLLNAMLLLPLALVTRRFAPRSWMKPDVVSTVSLAVLIALFMVDNLSNAMLNPIFAVAAGAVCGFVPRSRDGEENDLMGRYRQAIRLRESGDDHAAGQVFRKLVATSYDQTGLDDRSKWVVRKSIEMLSVIAREQGSYREADRYFQDLISFLIAGLQAEHSNEGLIDLAQCHAEYARFLGHLGDSQRAMEHRAKSVEVWRRLVRSMARDPQVDAQLARALNDMAWAHVSDMAGTVYDPAQATAIAKEAASLDPSSSMIYNTLGIAHYHQGNWNQCVLSLTRSITLSELGGNFLDFVFLALANDNLGESRLARSWAVRALEDSHDHRPWIDDHLAIHEQVVEIANRNLAN